MFGQHRARVAWLIPLILPALLGTALGRVTGVSGQSVAPSPSSTAAASPAASDSCGPVPLLDPGTFPGSPRIDNRFLPMIPGANYVLDGFVVGDDGLHHPHRVETTVTNVTKVIDGVRTLVVFDRDFQDGQLQESEIFFVAQDRRGTVWTLGEYPEEYDGGKLTGAPSTWISGVQGAHAGIAMLADPRVGTPTYLQGLALKVGFKDCATVFQTGQHTCVPTGCYDNVLVTDEFSPLDTAGGHQRKFYAPGVGVVRVTAASGADPETLELTKATRLCGSAFAQVRQQVLAQDRRGYSVAPSVYGHTPPAEVTLPAPC